MSFVPQGSHRSPGPSPVCEPVHLQLVCPALLPFWHDNTNTARCQLFRRGRFLKYRVCTYSYRTRATRLSSLSSTSCFQRSDTIHIVFSNRTQELLGTQFKKKKKREISDQVHGFNQEKELPLLLFLQQFKRFRNYYNNERYLKSALVTRAWIRFLNFQLTHSLSDTFLTLPLTVFWLRFVFFQDGYPCCGQISV